MLAVWGGDHFWFSAHYLHYNVLGHELVVSMTLHIFWHTSSAVRSTTSLCFKCVQIRFSLGLILIVRTFINIYDALPKSGSFILCEWERRTNRGHLFLQMLFCNDLISVCHLVDEKWLVGSCRQDLTVKPVGVATWSCSLHGGWRRMDYCRCWGRAYIIGGLRNI